jgi:hypothetical protein
LSKLFREVTALPNSSLKPLTEEEFMAATEEGRDFANRLREKYGIDVIMSLGGPKAGNKKVHYAAAVISLTVTMAQSLVDKMDDGLQTFVQSINLHRDVSSDKGGGH